MALRHWITLAVLVLLAVMPPVFIWMGNPFYVDLATRLVILGIAATSLNLILGYGGLISFGHAAFVGIGAYAVGIPAYHMLYGGGEAVASFNGMFQIPLAVAVSALFALITGAICLRTKGVYFIMITMAFAQMVYYFFISIEEYGADDGLVIDMRSQLPFIELDEPLQLYFFCYASLIAALLIVRTIANSRFGMVLQGAKGNNERMVTLGYNTYLYKLTAYVISGAMAGYAGALLGNFTTFISPEMMDWSRSGELMFMVILGGAATTLGPLMGSAVFIIIEEVLSNYTIYWHLPFGLMLIAVVLFARGGLMGVIGRGRDGK
ncbi:branched-chain amino acid ABC transporter permease [Maritimibacter sp. 55A14]|uniref:branched-chain amino acid ABC transporter permease n=1 Tax=Maritimibacter sp. 55A14 TaxID=2174844 RepID=UPI000D60786B|nr:branched-chain amino acid ABC transporter permease [Maritimibacter sp. 55A14]PWE34445.1 branched-chain amino acid ABC transporter permease [Maritimibacter sp. 55A14]